VVAFGKFEIYWASSAVISALRQLGYYQAKMMGAPTVVGFPGPLFLLISMDDAKPFSNSTTILDFSSFVV
jgi:hypothetical protein